MNHPIASVLTAAVGISCIATLWAAYGPSFGSATPPASPEAHASPQAAQPPASSSGPPRITFAATTHDFGATYETERRSASIQFTNTGGDRLVIRDVKTSCGCTATRLDKREYGPGESGSIDVTFSPSGSGQQSKYITVISNADPKVSRVTIKADVKPFLIFEPAWLQLGVLPYGQAHRATVSVSSPYEEFIIESVKATREYANARIVQPEEAEPRPRVTAGAKTIELLISPEAPWGGCYFALEVTATGRPFPGADRVTHTSSMRVAAQLFGELRADPDMFRFGVDPGEAVVRTVRLNAAAGRSFAILETVADVNLPGVKVTATRVAPDSWELSLRATAPRAPVRCVGKVTVRTDVPGEETIDIGILGVVQAHELGG